MYLSIIKILALKFVVQKATGQVKLKKLKNYYKLQNIFFYIQYMFTNRNSMAIAMLIIEFFLISYARFFFEIMDFYLYQLLYIFSEVQTIVDSLN